MQNTITQSFIKRKQQPEEVIQHIKSFPVVLASNGTSETMTKNVVNLREPHNKKTYNGYNRTSNLGKPQI